MQEDEQHPGEDREEDGGRETEPRAASRRVGAALLTPDRRERGKTLLHPGMCSNDSARSSVKDTKLL